MTISSVGASGAVPFRPLPDPAGPVAAPVRRPPDAAAASGPVSLQDILTPEERDFFDQVQALGPLSYSPRGPAAPAVDAPLGQRLDVRG